MSEINSGVSDENINGNGSVNGIFAFFNRILSAYFHISVTGVLCGTLSPFWWVFEVLSSFRVNYTVGLLIGFSANLIKRKYLNAFLCLAIFSVNGYPLLPYLYSENLVLNQNFSKTVKLAGINVHSSNKQHDLVLNYIASKKPDIAVFTEINDRWLENLKKLEAEYPYFIALPRPDNFGIAAYSRIRPQKLEIKYFSNGGLPSVLMTFEAGSGTVTLLGTHPLPPRTSEYTIGRNIQMNSIMDLFSGISSRKIVIGDLNTPPWVDLFQKLLATGGFKDSSLGRGVHATWPVEAWWLFGIPIDHCLISHDLSVIDRAVGPDLGSDHFPVFVELGIP
ncbi:MAG: endonuclease/exonuclease/phosphatase family protein [Candidatus Riflebacteria bacterium]|nr:endonuclease/exonuclease/phosphatase family protein [Candidatus Riflebacteria bacterium]